MKRYLLIFLLPLCVSKLYSADADTIPVIYSWKLDDRFNNTVPVSMDTNLTNFHSYNPVYGTSINNTFLGNIGSPVISNVFEDRLSAQDQYPFFIVPYLPYFHTAEYTNFYNTRKPFSSMLYTYGPNSSVFRTNKEETFEAFHTQNINPKLNFGLRYHVVSSRGHFSNLHVKKNAFRFFSSYTSQRYVMHSVFNFNRSNSGESGGIRDSLFVRKAYTYPTEIPTLISGSKDVSNVAKTVRYYDFLLTQKLKLFTIASKVDSSSPSKGRNVAEPVITHVFKMDRASLFHSDISSGIPELYDNYFFNTNETSDSVRNFRIRNTLQLDFKSTFRRKVQTGIYGLVGHEFEQLKFKSLWDTSYLVRDPSSMAIFTPYEQESGDTLKGVNRRDEFSTIFVSTGIYGNFWNKVKAEFSGTFYLIGYRAGETSLRGNLYTNFNFRQQAYQFDVEGLIENKIPNLLYENYYSNNYIWNRSLLSENRIRLSGRIVSPSKNFEVRGNYNVIRNHIYFGQNTIPENYDGYLNYFSIEVAKTFKLWKIFSSNKLIYQVSDNEKVLPVPALIAYNSTYIDHTFRFKSTNGELQINIGFDIFYNTRFYGFEYSPALSQFYVQEKEKIGNYPLMDAFLNVKLKKTKFFVRFEHFNSSLFEQRYYSAIRYPYNQMAVKFGISWLFYD